MNENWRYKILTIISKALTFNEFNPRIQLATNYQELPCMLAELDRRNPAFFPTDHRYRSRQAARHRWVGAMPGWAKGAGRSVRQDADRLTNCDEPHYQLAVMAGDSKKSAPG